ncbi:MAG: MgtC/SapB family protein [Rhodospirillaceae bacterium]
MLALKCRLAHNAGRTMTTFSTFSSLALALALAFFFGLAFEDFYGRAKEQRPGGIRTFPMLALVGGVLYLLDPVHLLPLCAGFLSVAGWLGVYYFRRVNAASETGELAAGMMVPVCNVLALLLGPAALAEPVWVPVGMTAAAVLFLTSRDKLHRFARTVEISELVTAGKFLVLTGLILPLLPDHAVTALTPITPRQAWLALIAVSAVSYASYLLQRYVLRRGASLLIAVLGGLYSSTATAISLARVARLDSTGTAEAQAGIVLSTAVMYLRILAIVSAFNLTLARELAPILLALAAAGAAFGLAWHLTHRDAGKKTPSPAMPENPLALSTGLAFAMSFILISIAVAWSRAHFGAGGLYTLAAIVGFADVDPFVLNVAQNNPLQSDTAAAMAIVVAASCNNLLKAGYATFAAGWRRGMAPAAALTALAAGGLAIAWWNA